MFVLYVKLQAKKDADAAAKAAKQAETAAPEDGAAATAEETKPEEPKAEGAEDNSDDEDEDDEIKFVAVPVSKPSSGKKKITIQINARTKRKRTTLIAGLDAFGLNAKELTKPLSKKFATSASVVDDNSVQLNGDLRYDIPDFFLEQYNIPPNSYSIVERGFK